MCLQDVGRQDFDYGNRKRTHETTESLNGRITVNIKERYSIVKIRQLLVFSKKQFLLWH